MAQTARNINSNIWSDFSNLASNISTLRANIQTGSVVRASDITLLRTLMNNAMGHYHNYVDAMQLATFGAGYGDNPGAGDRNNYYVSGGTNSSVLTGATASLPGLSLGTTVTAQQHNLLVSAAAVLRTHAHSINDQTTL